MAGEQTIGRKCTTTRAASLVKPRWQRLIIAFAGPFMNMVLAVALLTGLYMVKFQKVADEDMRGRDRPRDGRFARGQGRDSRITTASSGSTARRTRRGKTLALRKSPAPTARCTSTIERSGEVFRHCGDAAPGRASPALGFAGWDERGQIQLGAVEPAMPAEKAGLKKGDLLMTVNGQPIHFADQSSRRLPRTAWRQADRRSSTSGTASRMWSPCSRYFPAWTLRALDDRRDSAAEAPHHYHQALFAGGAQRIRHRQNSKGALLIVQFLKGC